MGIKNHFKFIKKNSMKTYLRQKKGCKNLTKKILGKNATKKQIKKDFNDHINGNLNPFKD